MWKTQQSDASMGRETWRNFIKSIPCLLLLFLYFSSFVFSSGEAIEFNGGERGEKPRLKAASSGKVLSFFCVPLRGIKPCNESFLVLSFVDRLNRYVYFYITFDFTQLWCAIGTCHRLLGYGWCLVKLCKIVSCWFTCSFFIFRFILQWWCSYFQFLLHFTHRLFVYQINSIHFVWVGFLYWSFSSQAVNLFWGGTKLN